MNPLLAALAVATLTATTTAARPPHHRFPLQPVQQLVQRETPTPSPDAGNVVLIHGFLDSGKIWRTLENRLTRHGYHCLVPELRPNDGRGGLDQLAHLLKQQIDDEFGPSQPVSIIGFSMGGIIARYYLQDLGGADRCDKLLTISSPHNGTRTAYLYPSKGALQMRPGSRFLTRLAKNEAKLKNLSLVSYRTPLDLMILPARSSHWKIATNVKVTVPAHPFMPGCTAVIADIEKRLAN
ncbi:MAG: alpha/beta fold hydrolase [Verrucomicrobiota bacterium JB025]|nr:alpha/beta fold hydrolase [Verrucomicrobiota bacterium JB025]